MKTEDIRLSIIGLGYVGLPLAVAFGCKRSVIGFDLSEKRIRDLQSGEDNTLECDKKTILNAKYLGKLIKITINYSDGYQIFVNSWLWLLLYSQKSNK